MFESRRFAPSPRRHGAAVPIAIGPVPSSPTDRDTDVRGPQGPAPRAGRQLWPLLGPAFVTAIAYVDPGNFATNITAGSTYGYLLVWVIILSNLMAMLIQYLSAKAGVATGKSLPALCRDNLPRPMVARAVGPGRAGGHRHRPGRGRGWRAGPQAALRPAVARRRHHHRSGGVRAARPEVPRPPTLRGRDHRAARGDPAGVRLRHRHQRRGLDGDPRRLHAPLRRLRQHPDRRRHARCDRHAARDLPARCADQRAVPAAHRGRAPYGHAQPAHRRRRPR